MAGVQPVRDDFGALDLLSAGNFHWSPRDPAARKRKKKLFSLPRRRSASKAKRPLVALLPVIAALPRKRRVGPSLKGWPVALSWPSSHNDTPPDHSS